MSRVQVQNVMKHVRLKSVEKVSRAQRNKTGGGTIPGLTKIERYFIQCHAGKELTQGIDGAFELGLGIKL